MTPNDILGGMKAKSERIAVLFTPAEMEIVNEAIAIFARERGVRSNPKASSILNDVIVSWAEREVGRVMPLFGAGVESTATM